MRNDEKSKYRVVIVSDSRAAQYIIENAFNGRPEFEVVGVASDAIEGENMIRSLAPDVVTIDLLMPYIDGSKFLTKFEHRKDICKIIISDNVSNIALVSNLKSAGATLCLSKTMLAVDRNAFFKKIAVELKKIESDEANRGWVDLSSDVSRRSGVLSQRKTLNYGIPIPLDEEKRIQLVTAKHLNNLTAEPRFDLITRLIAEVTVFPACLINFIDRDSQWTKSAFGFDADRMDRHVAFCSHTIAGDDAFVVNNAVNDPIFRNNPLVVGEAGIRAYAGYPIAANDGTRLGALCVLDTNPRAVPRESCEISEAGCRHRQRLD